MQVPARSARLPGLGDAVVGYGVLVAGLVAIVILPEIANSLLLALLALALVFGLARRDTGLSLRQPATALPLAACGLILIAAIITARDPLDVLVAAFFVAFAVAGAITAAWRRLPRPVTPALVAGCAFAGVFASLAVAVYEALILGRPRVGYAVSNPIHFADLVLTVGFVGLVGLFSNRPWARALGLAAPVLALAAVWLSGSRGPLLAAVAMLGMVMLLGFVWGGRRLRIGVVAVAALALVGAVGITLAMPDLVVGRMGRLVGFDQIDLGTPDASTAIRLSLYEAAFNAFLASPVYGYGLVGFVAAAAAFPPFEGEAPAFDHLHNDIADFAVSTGILGLVAYFLLLLAPLVAALRAPADALNRRAAVLLGTAVPLGYLVMGATNAMLGVLSQSLLYVVVIALVIHFARPPEQSQR